MFSKAPVNSVPLLRDHILPAVQSSRQWKEERQQEAQVTHCLTTMIPESEADDISITMWVGQKEGLELLNILKMKPTWSSLLGHLSP